MIIYLYLNSDFLRKGVTAMIQKQKNVMAKIAGGLIVSCQAREDDPIYMPGIIEKMAASAEWGGAVGLRINTPEHIRDVRKMTDLPIIGLWKIEHDDSPVFLTPHMESVQAVVDAGSDIVAVDATDRLNHDGEKAYDIIPKIRDAFPDILILADVRDDVEADIALKKGAHMVAPTLYRFSEHAKSIDSPDFEMLAKIVRTSEGRGKVLMEGKINTPEEAMQSLYLGAHAVVVGSAITRPHLTTLRFTTKINKYEQQMPLKY